MKRSLPGNLFDYGSTLLTQELINLWWTLPNFSGRPAA
jgi:hypothetical protein